MKVPRFAILALALLALSFTLSACGGSDNSTVEASLVHRRASPRLARLVQVYPAIVIKRGVVEKNGRWRKAYTCKRNLRAITLEDFGAVDYDGTIIRFTEVMLYDRPLDQDYIALQFSGDTRDFSSKVVSLITTEEGGGDDTVTSLRSSMIKSGGVQLSTQEYYPARLSYTPKIHRRLVICIRP
jgi:hypothetical protein